MKNGSRLFSLDVIRAFAIVGVVFIHLAHSIYARTDFIGGSTWWLAQSINALFRISIPLFIMLSGYLLLGKQETLKQTFNRITHRLFIPLVFWTVLYFLWEKYWINAPTKIADLLTGFLGGGVYHLYFLFIMLGLYVLLPVLRTVMHHASQEIKTYVTYSSLVFGLAFTALLYFVFKDSNPVNILTISLPYLGYFLAGGMIRNYSFDNRQLKIMGTIWLVSTLATAILGYWNMVLFSMGNETFWNWISYFDNYNSLNVMAASLSGFIMLLHVPYQAIKSTQFQWIITAISRSALAIYVLHPLVMNIVDRQFGFQVDFMNESLLIYFLKRASIVFALTLMLAYAVTVLPVIKKTVGEK